MFGCDGDEMNIAAAALVFVKDFLHRRPPPLPWFWHACHISTQRQMGPAFYVVIKEEFVPSQTRHPWPPRLLTLIIHTRWGERCQGWASKGEEGETEDRWKREITHSSGCHGKVLLTSACPSARPFPPTGLQWGSLHIKLTWERREKVWVDV